MAMMDNGRIRAVAVLGLAVLLGLIASSVGKRDRNEILDEQFCQVYYTLPSGECSELRSRVRSEVRGNGTPTLELGNKDTQPAMVFLHDLQCQMPQALRFTLVFPQKGHRYRLRCCISYFLTSFLNEAP
jgi:hypothetical protein